MRSLTLALLVLSLSSGAGLAAEPSDGLPPGLCWVDPAIGGYRAHLFETFGPPSTVPSKLERLAVDCSSLEAADAGRHDPPQTIVTQLRALSDEGLPHERPAYLDALEKRFAGPDVLGRDDKALYLAQHRQRPAGSLDLSGANAYTMIEGRPTMLNVYAYGTEDAVEPAGKVLAAIVERLVPD